MTNFDFLRLFGNSNDSNSASKRRAKKSRQGRTCRIEELEGREMLSVSPWSLANDFFNQSPQSENETVIVDGTIPETTSNAVAAYAPTLLADAPNPATITAINSQYGLNLPSNSNVVEIAATESALRSAITNAAAGDVIVVQGGSTIMLTGGNLSIVGKSLTIVSLGSESLTIDADYESRIFNISANSTVTLAGLTITHGFEIYGGGIENFGTLTLTHCTITENEAYAGGGGIDNEGTLTLIHSRVLENLTWDGVGGGIANWGGGTLTVMLTFQEWQT
jgi:hypothetical protein